MAEKQMKKLAKETAIYGVSSILGKFLNWLLGIKDNLYEALVFVMISLRQIFCGGFLWCECLFYAQRLWRWW